MIVTSFYSPDFLSLHYLDSLIFSRKVYKIFMAYFFGSLSCFVYNNLSSNSHAHLGKLHVLVII